MSNDIEEITSEKPTTKDLSDFTTMGAELAYKINFKTAILLFLAGLIIFSSRFENALPDHYKDIDSTNSKGTMLQLSLLAVIYLIIDLLIQGELL